MAKSAARASAVSEQELSFEAITARLEGIAKELERGDAPLEQALQLFEEGVGLARQGGRRLDAAERKLEQLLQDDSTAALELPENGTAAGRPAGR